MIVECRNLSVRYGGVEALNDLSIAVDEGERVCIIGPNGAGKSTLLRAISGLVRPSQGSIWYSHERIDQRPIHKIAELGIGHVPEGRRVFADMTVEENLRVGALGRHQPNDVRSDVLRMYEYFPVLGERRKRLGGTLSGGEQQMLALARALMLRPRLLMLDEPSLGLAPNIVIQMAEILKRIAIEDGVALLLIEQNASVAFGVSERGYVLSHGQVVMADHVDVLKNKELAEVYLGGSRNDL